MVPIEAVAHEAATRAGALVRARHGARPEVSFKSDVDLVTATDRDAERLIVDIIRASFPDHAVVAEESPAVAGTAPYCWYVDPLDGTTNFAHGFPHFAISIAVVHAGEIVVAVVLDPLRGERFAAVRGGGARLNGARITVSATSRLDAALLATGFAADRRQRPEFYLAYVHEALARGRCVRRAGSAALDLCYVACGRLDAYWEWQLGPWDTAAGRLIVEEAGGTVSAIDGGAHVLGGPSTLASNGPLHLDLLGMIASGERRIAQRSPDATPRT